MDVVDFAELDAAKRVVETSADRTGLTVFGDDVRAVVFGVVDALNGADNGSGATSAGFLERSELFLGHVTALNGHTHVFGELDKTLVGNRWKNRSR